MATVGGKVTSWLEKDSMWIVQDLRGLVRLFTVIEMGIHSKVLNRGRYQMFSLTKRCSSNFISGNEKVTGVRLTLLE